MGYIRRSCFVIAYCRVSTDSEEQESSYEAQVTHYTNFIQAHDGWELAGIFADEGLSGTQAKTRPQFNAMIEACENGDVNLVITKSISQNVRMGINFGFQEGRGRVNFSSFLGYRRGDKPGPYEIVPAEADITVKMVMWLPAFCVSRRSTS